jgi:hypothetical protein
MTAHFWEYGLQITEAKFRLASVRQSSSIVNNKKSLTIR